MQKRIYYLTDFEKDVILGALTTQADATYDRFVQAWKLGAKEEHWGEDKEASEQCRDLHRELATQEANATGFEPILLAKECSKEAANNLAEHLAQQLLLKAEAFHDSLADDLDHCNYFDKDYAEGFIENLQSALATITRATEMLSGR